MQANDRVSVATHHPTNPHPLQSSVGGGHHHHHEHHNGKTSIFFCFDGNNHDTADTPNKITIHKERATVADLTEALRKCFKIHCALSLTYRIPSGEIVTYGQDINAEVPINDRHNVVLVRLTEPPHEVPAVDIESWLQKEGIIDPDAIRIFRDNKFTPDLIRTLRDDELSKYGINNNWTRAKILEAIRKYDLYPPQPQQQQQQPQQQQQQLPLPLPLPLPPQPQPMSSLTAEMVSAGPPDITAMVLAEEAAKRKRDVEVLEALTKTVGVSPQKKAKLTPKMKKAGKIKFKDVDALVKAENMPIHVGMTVFVTQGNVVGHIVMHKDKAVISYNINDETRYGSIAKFFKDVTGDALQEKGASWGNLIFKDPNSGRSYSLEGLKYIVNGPKKPVSAFLYFSNEARIKHKELKPDAFARLAGELWKKLSYDEKQPYRVLEEQDKERFARDKQEHDALVKRHTIRAIAPPTPVPVNVPPHPSSIPVQSQVLPGGLVPNVPILPHQPLSHVPPQPVEPSINVGHSHIQQQPQSQQQ